MEDLRDRKVSKFLLEKDVEFVVGNQLERGYFRAHRSVLAANSAVFQAMLYGPLAEKECIYIPDVEIKSFSIMLRFFYTGITTIDGLEDALSTGYTATKYMVHPLRKKCLEYIEKHLSAENACTIYEFAVEMDLPSVRESCLKMFVLRTEEVMVSEDFASASLATVQKIIAKQTLAVPSESFLLNAVLRWGQVECSRQGHQDLRTVVAPLLSCIRWLFMLPEDVVAARDNYGVLSTEELDSILTLMVNPERYSFPLPKILEDSKDTFRNVVWLDNESNLLGERCFQNVDSEFSDVNGDRPSFSVEVECGGLFLAGFCIVFRSPSKSFFFVGVTVSVTIPGRYSGVKFFRQLPVSGEQGVSVVYFPRAVFLKAGESLDVFLQLSKHSRNSLQCKFRNPTETMRCFSHDLKFSYVLRSAGCAVKMIYTRLIIAWSEKPFLHWS